MFKAGEAHQIDGRNPVQGVRSLGLRSTWLAWGAFDWRQSKPGLTGSGTSGKSAGCEKLNHERPARACQLVLQETVPNRKRLWLRGKGTLLHSVP
mgnify:CR=1 FL=1